MEGYNSLEKWRMRKHEHDFFSVWKYISYIFKDVTDSEEQNEVQSYTVLNINTSSYKTSRFLSFRRLFHSAYYKELRNQSSRVCSLQQLLCRIPRQVIKDVVVGN